MFRAAWIILAGLAAALFVALALFGWNRATAGDRAVLAFGPAEPEHPSGAGVPEALRVATYNISLASGGETGTDPWRGSRAERIEICRKIGEFLREEGVEIAVLNEVDFDSTWSGRINMAEIIADAGGFAYRVEQRNADVRFPFFRIRTGNAILSRYPVEGFGRVELPNPRGWVQFFTGAFDPFSPAQKRWAETTRGERLEGLRFGVRATIRVAPDHLIDVIGVHLPSRGATLRDAGADALVEWLRDASRPCILMGDINAFPRELARREVEAASAVDRLLVSGAVSTLDRSLWSDDLLSYPSEAPRVAIDWIFVTPPLRVASMRAVPTRLCDHLPVIATVEWER